MKRRQKQEAELQLEERVESVIAVQEYESTVDSFARKRSESGKHIERGGSTRDGTECSTIPPDGIQVESDSSEHDKPSGFPDVEAMEGTVADMSSVLESSEIPDVLHFATYMGLMYDPFPETKVAADLLIHISKENDVFQSPYLVALDHKWKTLVIAIRGTLSVADLLVDLKVEMQEFHIPELGEHVPKQFVHSGFFKTAENVLENLEESGALKPLEKGQPYEEYRLTICGHSLGAAGTIF